MPERKVSSKTKKKVAASQKWRCNLCKVLLDETFEVDHRIPLWKNGSNATWNLQVCCNNFGCIKKFLLFCFSRHRCFMNRPCACSATPPRRFTNPKTTSPSMHGSVWPAPPSTRLTSTINVLKLSKCPFGPIKF